MVPDTKTRDGISRFRRDLPRILRRTLLIWTPLMMLLGAGFIHFYRHEIAAHLNDVRSDARIYVQGALNALRYRLPWIAKDTIFLKELQRMGRSWDADPATRSSRMAELLATFMSQRSQLYAQIRILGPSGKELVRVDNEHGVPRIVPPGRLRDESHHYYVGEIRDLKADEIYLSPLDLNVEHKEVERPLKPLLRFGVRVPDGGDQPGSLLILNYLGRDLIARLNQAFVKYPEHFWLVNEGGYWLKGPREEDDWGFMVPGREEANMARRYPALWQAIRSTPERGQRMVEGGLLTYALFSPTEELHIPGHKVKFPSGQRWYVIEYLPEEIFLEAGQSLRQGLLLGYVAIGLLLAAVLFHTGWISERRRRSAKQLADSRMRFRSLLESTPDAIVVSDSQGRIVLTNDQALSLFGYSQEELHGQPVELLMPERYRKDHVRERTEYLADPRRRHMGEGRCMRARRKDGGIFPIDISLNSVDTSEGRLVISEVRDISVQLASERKILDLNQALSRHNAELEDRVRARTAELEQARREAERLARLKSEFLANMSHEIRTPMNAILGFAYLLERAPLPPEAAEPVAKIGQAGRSLQHLINDILDFSKLEAGRLEIETAPFELDRLLDNLAAILSHGLGSKAIELAILPPPPQGNRVCGDALRLEQVLINLGSNAIKFTEAGQVSIRVDLLAAEGTGVRLRFAVRDTGIGISPRQQQEIFSPFAQADGSTTRRFGGTGLGLSISRQLVTLMGGELMLQSEQGRGSEFSFVLDLERAEVPEPAQPQMTDPELLIADDSEIAREAIRRTAELLGWRPDTVASGAAALERISGRQSDETDTVVVLDWKMPDLDGLATARRIREDQGGAHIPIVIMATGHERAALLDRPDALLMDAFLEKPVTVSALRDAVTRAQIVSQGAAPATPAARMPQPRLAGLKMLVVDDSEINREVAQCIFTGEGARVALAEDGQQALELLNGGESYDIVLMDIQMPVMDGHAATRAIRRNPALAGLPVVAISAGAFKEQREQAEAAGMDGFIPKPLEVEAAVELIRRFTHRPEERPAASDGTAPSPATESAGSGFPGIDTTQGVARLGEELYRRLLHTFGRDYDNFMEKIAGLPPRETANLLHNLKGVAGNLLLAEVATLAAEAERRLKATEEAGDTLVRLRAAMATTLDSIARYASADLDMERSANR